MPRAIPIPLDSIKAIFDALDILAKIDRQELTTEVGFRKEARKGTKYEGGATVFYKHRRRTDGKHVATTHVMEMPGISPPPHRHGKDIVLGELKFSTEEE